MRALRSILGIRWQERVSNVEVPDRAKLIIIQAMLMKAQLLWVGHVIRMDDTRMSRQLLYGELETGKRDQGRPRKRYNDTWKSNLQWCNTQPKELEHCERQPTVVQHTAKGA
eukprot:TRINITY_DN23640_c0_g1_i12.p1 TRINITY_DN23640_c0_g1~~TRINITY_DN23640_c0_g1_i12.p1  ORF type:complete len:112 (-),score=21.51 TRINITY_DN23640_c0_g1_i12:2-337(-)